MTEDGRAYDKIGTHNRRAWDRWVEQGINWTIPVADEVIEAARNGEWHIALTEARPIPRDWFLPLAGAEVLCLAGAGGQQGPVLAAAGAKVTVFDNSPRQLSQDRAVAARHKLPIWTVEGDMRDLSAFTDDTFDLIVHPVSNVFVPDVRPVWCEAYRVLKDGGALLSGFMNPMEYIFHHPTLDNENRFEVRYPLPYSDLHDLSAEELNSEYGKDAPLEFSHSFDDQIGGQIDAGFVITGFFEDRRSEGLEREFFPSYFVTRAEKRKE